MVTRRSTQETLPSVKNPPLTEVICDLKFKPLTEFKVPHYGLFWQRILDNYPNIEHQPPIGWPMEGGDLIAPHPRVWFLDSKGQTLIQIQGDRFIYNWRKLSDSDDEIYPRFDNIFPKFQENLLLFSTFLKDLNLGEISPVTCEMAYINHIPVGDTWKSFDEIRRILPDVGWRQGRGRFLKKVETFLWQTSFALPEDFGKLMVKAQSAARKIDKRPVLAFELRTVGLGEDNSLDAVWRWFNLSHEWIVRGFFDLTGPKIQETWE